MKFFLLTVLIMRYTSIPINIWNFLRKFASIYNFYWFQASITEIWVTETQFLGKKKYFFFLFVDISLTLKAKICWEDSNTVSVASMEVASRLDPIRYRLLFLWSSSNRVVRIHRFKILWEFIKIDKFPDSIHNKKKLNFCQQFPTFCENETKYKMASWIEILVYTPIDVNFRYEIKLLRY